MIHITDTAAQYLRDLQDERELTSDHGLRLSVEKGGCAGMQYNMEVASRRDSDLLNEHLGGRVIVDAASVQYLEGCTLDYCDDLAGTGFRILNPRATRSCGCGTSFEAAPANSES